MAYAVGIDLGTTNTVVAAVRDGVASTLTNEHGARLLPSIVSFHPSGSVLVGTPALERRLLDAPNTIYSIKRLIGRSWDSPEVRQARERLAFQLSEGPKGGTLVGARGDTFSLPEISAFVLREAKAMAEAALGGPVQRAVITVPANFNDLQRAATKTAGRLAGLEVLRILNEPTAAALAYGPEGRTDERVAVYDLGGGTFDITLLSLASNVFEVLATAGDSGLGGDDIDVVVADRMAEDLLKRHRFDARANPNAFARLRILGEGVKRELSTRDACEIEVDDLIPGDKGATVAWRFRMTRPELEWASLSLVERTFKVCQRALDSAGLTVTDVHRVLLVGGVTRMPMVARKVEQFFGRTPIVRINPDEVVALGAAIQAGLLDRSRSRTAQAAIHPRIDEGSVLPSSSSAAAEAEAEPLPDLPVVRSGGSVVGLPARSVRPVESTTGLPVVVGRRSGPPAKDAERPAPSKAPPPKPAPRKERARPKDVERFVLEDEAPAPNRIEPGAAPEAEPVAPHAEFLPGAVSKPLVFDVPDNAALAPFEIERDEPTVRGRTIRGPLAPGPSASVGAASRSVASLLASELAAPAMAGRTKAAETVIGLGDDARAPPAATPQGPATPANPVPAVPAASANASPASPPAAVAGPNARPGPDTPAKPKPLPPNMTLPAGRAAGPAGAIAAASIAPSASAAPTLGPGARPAVDLSPPPPRRAPLLVDVTPLSLNVETVGDFCDMLIEANTPVPCDRTRTFATAADDQTTVRVRVAQGESQRFSENTFLGELELTGIPPAARGETAIAVTFEIDVDGILNVRARDVKTGHETAARIQLVGSQSDPADLAAMAARQAAHPLASSLPAARDRESRPRG